MSDINDMLRLSYKTLNELQLKLGQLNEVHQDVVNLKDEATKGNVIGSKIPEEFKNKFEEVKRLSHQYLTDINAATNKYFEINNKVYVDNQNLFIEHIKDLHNKNIELQKQIERLEKVDLEKHFKELQKTLSEIFSAINAINLTFTSIVQTLTSIAQSLGATQTAIDTNHKETKQLLNSFNEENEKHLTEQDKQTLKSIESFKSFSELTKTHLNEQDNQNVKNITLLESKINSLMEQNILTQKGLKLNRIIAVVGFIIITAILIYVSLKKNH